jgi:hypothetical protein
MKKRPVFSSMHCFRSVSFGKIYRRKCVTRAWNIWISFSKHIYRIITITALQTVWADQVVTFPSLPIFQLVPLYSSALAVIAVTATDDCQELSFPLHFKNNTSRFTQNKNTHSPDLRTPDRRRYCLEDRRPATLRLQTAPLTWSTPSFISSNGVDYTIRRYDHLPGDSCNPF